MHTMPNFLRLDDARRNKTVYFEALTALEVEILDVVTQGPSGSVYGSAPGTNPEDAIVITPSGRKVQDKVVEGGQKTLDRMVRKGWLRFAKMPSEGGYFWPTQAAERLWKVLGRCK